MHKTKSQIKERKWQHFKKRILTVEFSEQRCVNPAAQWGMKMYETIRYIVHYNIKGLIPSIYEFPKIRTVNVVLSVSVIRNNGTPENISEILKKRQYAEISWGCGFIEKTIRKSELITKRLESDLRYYNIEPHKFKVVGIKHVTMKELYGKERND
jgi:hypothetical protein